MTRFSIGVIQTKNSADDSEPKVTAIFCQTFQHFVHKETVWLPTFEIIFCRLRYDIRRAICCPYIAMHFYLSKFCDPGISGENYRAVYESLLKTATQGSFVIAHTPDKWVLIIQTSFFASSHEVCMSFITEFNQTEMWIKSHNSKHAYFMGIWNISSN